jgi:hypothetical protein
LGEKSDRWTKKRWGNKTPWWFACWSLGLDLGLD